MMGHRFEAAPSGLWRRCGLLLPLRGKALLYKGIPESSFEPGLHAAGTRKRVPLSAVATRRHGPHGSMGDLDIFRTRRGLPLRSTGPLDCATSATSVLTTRALAGRGGAWARKNSQVMAILAGRTYERYPA